VVHRPGTEQFDRQELGETPLTNRKRSTTEPSKRRSATSTTTPANNTKLTFKITDVGSDSAYTEFVRLLSLTRDYLRSLVRRGASKLRPTSPFTTDDYRVKINPSPSRRRPTGDQEGHP